MLDAFLQHLGTSVDETIVLKEEKDFKEAREKKGIMKTPTMILYDDNGNEVDRVSGFSQNQIIEFLKKAEKLS
jgi:thioredoxin-related protein